MLFSWFGELTLRKAKGAKQNISCDIGVYFPSTEKASNTFPGIAFPEYPEVMNSMPPATTGPILLMEPPRALTPFTVWNS
jgi:hypothetical protein